MKSRAGIFTLDFLVISLLLTFCFIFLVFSEIIPSDLFLGDSKYKNNPEYIYKKDLGGMMLCTKSFYTSNLEKYYQDPELLFKNTTYLLKSKFKNKKRCVVIVDNVYLVVHKFTNNSVWDYLSTFPFRVSNAFRGWHNGQLLMKNGVHTTKPLLVIEKRFGPYCRTSYLVTNYITGIHGGHFFKRNSAFKEKWGETADNLQKLFTNLEDLKLRHIDFRLNSFIIKNGIPYLIDLERVRKFRFKCFLSKKSIPSSYFSALETQLKTPEHEAHKLFNCKSVVLYP